MPARDDHVAIDGIDLDQASAAFALFGGIEKRVHTSNLKGGQVTAMFGGVELDFRKANIAGSSAIIEINAVFGGVEVKIPPNWSADVQGSGIFGGFESNSVHLDPGQVPNMKQLIVRGSAVFGGVEIKN